MSTLNLRDLVREVIADELRPLIREQLLGDLPSALPETLFTESDSPPKIRTHRKRKAPASSLAREGGNFWTRSQKKALIDNMLDGMSMKACAALLGRTVESVDGRLTHKKSGLLVDGLHGVRPMYVRAVDGSRRLDIDSLGNVAVLKDPESGNSSAGYVTRDEFLAYFKHRL